MTTQTRTRTIIVRDCGHESDWTGMRGISEVEVGDEVACWSSCDHVPGRGPSIVRRIARIEQREEQS